MQHLEDGIIQELIDGEVPSDDLPPIQAHLAACEACRARLDMARLAAAEADELLTILDEVAAAAPSTEPLVWPIKRPHWSRNLAWAASLMLAVGLGYTGRDVINDVVGGRSAPEATVADTTPAVLSERARRDEELAAPPAAAEAAPTESRVEPALPRDLPVIPAAPPAVVGGMTAEDAARQAALGAAVRESISGRRDERREAVPQAAFNRTGSPANRAAPQGNVASPLELADAAKSMVAAQPVDLPTALRILGGSIKLIDGLVPDRLDAWQNEVMVVYRVRWGELLLAQHRVADSLVWHLAPPPGFPADSLAVLQRKVRP